ALALCQVYFTHARNVHDLLAGAHEMHLDPVTLLGVESTMNEAADGEVGAELPIHDAQHVPVECRRHPTGIIVGGLDDAAGLAKIGTEEQSIERTHRLTNPPEQRPRCRRVE